VSLFVDLTHFYFKLSKQKKGVSMGKLIGKVSEGCVVFSIFDNEAQVKGKMVLIRNIKIERRYLENGNWKSNNYYSEKALESLSSALRRYNNHDFDKEQSDETNKAN